MGRSPTGSQPSQLSTPSLTCYPIYNCQPFFKFIVQNLIHRVINSIVNFSFLLNWQSFAVFSYIFLCCIQFYPVYNGSWSLITKMASISDTAGLCVFLFATFFHVSKRSCSESSIDFCFFLLLSSQLHWIFLIFHCLPCFCQFDLCGQLVN